jgi:hypothetical protein
MAAVSAAVLLVVVLASPSVAAGRATSFDNPIWAGYGVYGLSRSGLEGTSVRAWVRGSWTVPEVTCPPFVVSAVSMWVGLSGTAEDGEPGAPLEQIATTSRCDGFGHAQYSAQYQMVNTEQWTGTSRDLGDQSGNPFPVDPGDVMIGSVLYGGDGRYDFNLRNDTKASLFSTSEQGSQRAAAYDAGLWIVEAPTEGVVRPLAEYDSATFRGCFSHLGPISSERHTGIVRFELSKPSFSNLSKASPTDYQESEVYGTAAVGSDFSVTRHG